MGDRRMAQLKLMHGSLYVYTHWYGSKFPIMVKEAVKKAAPRLGDEPYWTRIMVDQLTKPGRDEETGFGLLLKPDCEDEYNSDKPSIVVDAKDGSIKFYGRR